MLAQKKEKTESRQGESPNLYTGKQDYMEGKRLSSCQMIELLYPERIVQKTERDKEKRQKKHVHQVRGIAFRKAENLVHT